MSVHVCGSVSTMEHILWEIRTVTKKQDFCCIFGTTKDCFFFCTGICFKSRIFWNILFVKGGFSHESSKFEKAMYQ